MRILNFMISKLGIRTLQASKIVISREVAQRLTFNRWNSETTSALSLTKNQCLFLRLNTQYTPRIRSWLLGTTSNKHKVIAHMFQKKSSVLTTILIVLVLSTAAFYQLKNPEVPTNLTEIVKDGDLIFQTSRSAQSQAIQLATKSKYSHCGILFRENNQWLVFEAVQPVKATPLIQWIELGKDNHFVIKRLTKRDNILTPENLEKMRLVAEKFSGKNYDLTFNWSDNEIYCSELIWKIYQRGCGVELSPIEKLGEFDLSHPTVQEKMRERYGNNIPLNEIVISPAAVFDSPLLSTVATN